jgi:ABC-type glycerol-3-phosphate transport system substrate-binding protein
MIFWMMPDGAARTKEMMNNFLEPFNKENPDISVDVRVINRHTLWARIFTLKHEGLHEECPDLIAIPHYWTQLMAVTGLLENLTEMDKTIRVDDCLDPLRAHSYKADSADIYSCPWWFDISALHYREDHLKLISPEPRKLLSTWSGLLEACALLKEHFAGTEGYYPVQNSDWRGALSNRGVLPCLKSRGAYIISEDGKTCGFGEPAFERGLEDYIELALRKYMPILKERSSLGNVNSGRSSIAITRRQGVGMFGGGNQDLPVATVGVPRAGAHYANYLGGVNLGITKKGAHKQNALKLLKWLTGVESQAKYAAGTEVFPALDASFQNFLLSSPRRIQSYAQIIADCFTLPSCMAAGTVMEVLGSLLGAVSTAVVRNEYGKSFLQSEIKKAKEEADNILRLYGD